MKLSEMRQLLDVHNIQLTKSLGQNFLHDGNQLDRIVRTAELKTGENVLEIGPGLGPLTERLLASGASVLAIEKDGRLVEVLQQRFAGQPALRLIHDDALRVVEDRHDWKNWKLVANLPYSVASPLLVSLAQAAAPPERMVVTLQSEVAHRLAARERSADYGVLTLLVQLRFEPGGLFRIPASCFFPPPDVESACIDLRRRDQSLLPVELTRPFSRIVKRGFSQRRKMMFKLLRAEWPDAALEKSFQEVGIDRTIRAEAVSLQQFVTLTQCLAQEKV